MTRPAIIAALGLVVALAGARADESPGADAEAQAAGEAAKIEAAELSALNPLSTLDKATLDGFRDAPLFTPSRTRPSPPPPAPEIVAEAPPPPPEPEEEPAEPPTLKLSGIVQGPDGAVAYVAKDGEDTVEQLRLGDQIDGWLVSEIDPQALKLSLNEREQEYRLFVPANPVAASSGDDEDDSSSNDDSSSKDSSMSDDEDDDDESKTAKQPAPKRPSGAQRELEAARKAQREMQKRQQARPMDQQPTQP